MIKLKIENETDFKFKYKRTYKRVVRSLISILNIEGNTEVSIIIGNNKLLESVSAEYRNKKAPTDILSFPAGYKELKSLIGYNLLGDIYLSYEMVEDQAKKFGHSSKREWTYLFAHGVLHLLGYDHKTKSDEKNMNKLAYQAMEIVKVGRNE